MKNPLLKMLYCLQVWNQLRRYPELFLFSDAMMQISRVLLPARWNSFYASKRMKATLEFDNSSNNPQEPVNIHCVPLNLNFLWNGHIDNNLFFMAEQEFFTRNPHCYSTKPIIMEGIQKVIDVGACEGLFAFRMAKLGRGVDVHCFEPFKDMAKLIQKGAELNGVMDSIHVHSQALLSKPGFVKFLTSETPDAGKVVECSENDPDSLKSNSLDEFFKNCDFELNQHDLIKIDAEGSDFDVLKGARSVIESCRPQIAVTTYHKDEHAELIYRWLDELNLGYRFRLKGFSFWTSKPRPVLLQASTL